MTREMVVDDAIVVGENVFSKLESGVPRMRAAIEGAREMAAPVTFSVLTTVAAFAPLFFIPGVMGKIFFLIPAVVISVLLISLVESFFILPAHLGHGADRRLPRALAWMDSLQAAVSRGLERFSRRVYRPALGAVLRHRYVSLATAVALLLVTFAMVAGGLVPFSFFPKLEGDVVTATARLPFGAPLERTMEVQRQLEEAARQATRELDAGAALRGMFTRLGEGGGSREKGSHLVTVEINLAPSDQRPFTSADFGARWAKSMPAVPGIQSLVFNHSTGPGAGRPVEVQLSHRDTEVLARASEELTEALRGYRALSDIENEYAAGKPQLDFRLLPQARALGLTSFDIGRQLRSAFFGAEAVREQRGRNER